MAIANSASDKVKFCREYEVEIKGEEWPVHPPAQAILADRERCCRIMQRV